MNEEVVEVIESYNEYLEKVPSGSRKISDYLRGDHVENALTMILDFSDGMTWLTQASDLLKKNQVNVTFEIEKIHEFLHEINLGLEIQDYVLVADMFEYEIAPFFENVKPASSVA